jgi:UDP-glucose 4-epimerase
MNILITGGAGYIGSHTAKQILETTNYNLTILDNLSTGSNKTLQTLEKIRSFKFIKVDLKDFNGVSDILQQGNFDIIIHFAASIVVPESVANPTKYYLNNTANTTNLIKWASEFKVKKFIFSSTAAVYGEPKDIPTTGVAENFATRPINPYGASKLMSEQILQDECNICDMKFVIFRYFNVAGADIFYGNDELKPRIGQSFPDATHLIKVACEAAVGKREQVAIFGTDFSTPDSTGVRDYIHVDDLAQAHLQAIDYLDEYQSDIFNVGYGKGYSVREVLSVVKNIGDFKIVEQDRRAGDPASLIADNTKIVQNMSWLPRYDDLELICKSAYLWEKQ